MFGGDERKGYFDSDAETNYVPTTFDIRLSRRSSMRHGAPRLPTSGVLEKLECIAFRERAYLGSPKGYLVHIIHLESEEDI